MSGSLDDLRDSYKNSRQSKQSRVKSKRGHGPISSSTVSVYSSITKPDAELAETDNKFLIHDTQVNYSLNKKKRWEIKEDLISKMTDFGLSEEVRLYETLRTPKHYNLISVHKSKGQNLENNSHRSYRSVRNQEEAEARKRNTPKTEVKGKKPNRFKTVNLKGKKKNKAVEIERIVIDVSDEEEGEEAYSGRAEYIIQHDTYPEKDSKEYMRVRRTAHRNKWVSMMELDKLCWSESEEESMSDSREIEDQEECLGYVEFEKNLNRSNCIDFEDLVSHEKNLFTRIK
jgi:hypothetical protein